MKNNTALVDKSVCILSSLLTLFAVFTSVLSPANGQNWSALLAKQPGVVSYTFRNQFAKDMPGTLDYIRSLGMDHVEFSNLFNQQPDDIRVMLDRRNMTCPSYGVSYDDLIHRMETVIKNAKILGAKYVRLAWVPHDKPWDLTFAEKTASVFNEIGKKLYEHGLQFVYHNHGYEFQPFKKGTLFDVLMEKTNPLWVNFEIDILWTYFPGQDPARLIRKYPKRFKLMHLKDLKKGVRGDLSGRTDPSNDVVLGTGQIDIKSVLKASKKSSIEFFLLEDENDNSWHQVPLSLSYLQQLK
jgi:sugar phosphate isomerase/epimerase